MGPRYPAEAPTARGRRSVRERWSAPASGLASATGWAGAWALLSGEAWALASDEAWALVWGEALAMASGEA